MGRKQLYPWDDLKEIGDSFVVKNADTQKRNSIRFSGRQRGLKVSIYKQRDESCIVYMESRIDQGEKSNG